MSAMKKVPVVILNGFLGSGKTTLFRNLLAQARKQGLNVKAIVNDMSELDVDGELLGISEALTPVKNYGRNLFAINPPTTVICL